jgi:hypothetical protein
LRRHGLQLSELLGNFCSSDNGIDDIAATGNEIPHTIKVSVVPPAEKVAS